MANSENSYYLNGWGRVPKEGTNLENVPPPYSPPNLRLSQNSLEKVNKQLVDGEEICQ